MDEVADALAALEAKMGKRLGDAVDPLLVSVRSGAPFSMPGMMDTVLNLGLNDVSVGGLAKQTDNERFAYDSYRRFVQMFGKIVLDIDGEKFEHALEELRKERGVETDPELDPPTTCAGSSTGSRRSCWPSRGIEFPQDPQEQLRLAIEAVFRSWNGERARIYRKMEKIPDDLGTAVNVQTMVFGNKGDDSGTGVAFTRDPATGENRPYGDFLPQRAGRRRRRRHPRRPSRSTRWPTSSPSATPQLLEVMQTLQTHYRDMCDIEFTIEQGRLFLLQTRVGKRTAAAALRMAVEMEDEGAHRQARGGAARASRSSSTSCCTRSSILVPSSPRSRRASTRRRVPRSARSYFTADAAEEQPPTASASSSCGPRRRPTTCTA